MDVPQEGYDRIAALISSDTRSVGIDAKKTHVIILHKLMEIERRLELTLRGGPTMGKVRWTWQGRRDMMRWLSS